jgi:DNA-binding response OmpR family regulator
VQVIAALRKQEITYPMIMLTARSLSDDVVTGLNAGADDYVSKPFDTAVLLARIRAAIRRKVDPTHPAILSAGAVRLNTATREVFVEQELIALSPKEFALLEYLLLHKNKPVSRVELITHVWDEQANMFSNSVDVHMSYLRKKLAAYDQAQVIQTVSGVGYKICDV